MAFKLPRFDRTIAIVTKAMTPTTVFHQWWDTVVKRIELAINGLQEAVDAIELAMQAAEDAQAAADAAQAAADAAQAAIDDLPPSGSRPVSTTQALLTSDYIVLADATGGAITLTLPLAAAMMNPLIIRKVDGTGNAVNIDPAGSDSLNGGAVPIAITVPYEQRTVSSDGIDAWYLS